MLKVSKLINSASVYSLVKLWAERYVPDLSTLSSQAGNLDVSELVEATSLEGRTQTMAKLKRLLNTCRVSLAHPTILSTQYSALSTLL